MITETFSKTIVASFPAGEPGNEARTTVEVADRN